MVTASSWLWFDLASTLSVRPLGDGWSFCFPFFVICLDSGHWTFAADFAIALGLLGAYLLRFDGKAVHPKLTQELTRGDIALAIAVGIATLLLLVAVDPLRFVLG